MTRNLSEIIQRIKDNTFRVDVEVSPATIATRLVILIPLWEEPVQQDQYSFHNCISKVSNVISVSLKVDG